MSSSVSDEQTVAAIREIFEAENYLLDPRGAVAVAVSDSLKEQLGDHKLICFATAHPAKFPSTIQNALQVNTLPKSATHSSIEIAKKRCQKGYTCDQSYLEEALLDAMGCNWELVKGA